jgi:hypothetical protein
VAIEATPAFLGSLGQLAAAPGGRRRALLIPCHNDSASYKQRNIIERISWPQSLSPRL